MLQGRRSEAVSSVCAEAHHGLSHDTSVHRIATGGGCGMPAVRGAPAWESPRRTEGRETPPPPVPPRAPVVRTGSTYASHCVGKPTLSSSSFSNSRPPAPPPPPQASLASSVEEAPCSMTLLERLIRTSSIWFLPDVGRVGAVHYLQGKEVGNFIVRQSSKKGTLALSVRLPPDAGPYIEHYLVEATAESKHRLEGSHNHFASVPVLVCHYCQCCDELPVQLCLPTVLLQATTRQELSAFSLLGQELWVSSLLKSAPSSLGSSASCASSQASLNPDHNANVVQVPTFRQTITLNSPVTTTPPLVTAPVRPSFLPLQNSTADTGKLATRVPDPPPSPRDEKVEVPATVVSEIAGRSAFYVGVADSSQPATAPSKAPPASKPTKQAAESSSTAKEEEEEDEKPRCLTKPSPRRRRKLPESSPETYYCSSLADKISDYEDIWGTTANGRGGANDSPAPPPVLSTFKPEGLVCQSTQTEVTHCGGSLPEGLDSAGQGRNLSRSISGAVNNSTKPEGGQFSSPFYSEPVDSLFLATSEVGPLRIDEGPPTALPRGERPTMRHSEPNMHSLRSSGVQRSSDLTTTFDETTSSCASDHLMAVSAPTLHGGCDGPPSRCGRSWSVDPSWKWLVSSDDDDADDDDSGGGGDPKFPTEDADDSEAGGPDCNLSTVEEIIGLSAPDLRVPPAHPLTEGNVLRASRYDNLDSVSVAAESVAATDEGSCKHNHGEEDALTEFCEPWDSLRWERLLRLVEPSPPANKEPEDAKMSTDSLETASVVSGEDLLLTECPTLALERRRSSGFQEHLDMLLASRKLGGLYKKDSTVGSNVRSYIFKLVQERNTTFAMTIENFIQCTQESHETSPAVVMRNIRQFMSGMKNYLLKHGEGQFEQLVQEEQSKLKPDEFMNIDAIIEVSLHRLVIKPLRRYLYQLFVKQYTESGSLKLLSDNIKFARTKTPQELGIKSDLEPPRGVTLELVQHFLSKLQRAYSPLRKLENLLAAISVIYGSVQKDRKSHQDSESLSLGADDFLPIFLHVLVQCGMVSAEVEADYMWGLLHPSLLTGEGGYYLTTLSSAVHVLKALGDSSAQEEEEGEEGEGGEQDSTAPATGSPATVHRSASSCKKEDQGGTTSQQRRPPTSSLRYPRMADLQGFMQIVIPDELSGSIVAKTLPVMPHMTTKEVRKMIAHKFKVTNPEDYGLFKLVKGEETQLADNECPQAIKADLLISGVDCRFAYKRYDVKFVWPFSEKPA